MVSCGAGSAHFTCFSLGGGCAVVAAGAAEVEEDGSGLALCDSDCAFSFSSNALAFILARSFAASRSFSSSNLLQRAFSAAVCISSDCGSGSVEVVEAGGRGAVVDVDVDGAWGWGCAYTE